MLQGLQAALGQLPAQKLVDALAQQMLACLLPCSGIATSRAPRLRLLLGLQAAQGQLQAWKFNRLSHTTHADLSAALFCHPGYACYWDYKQHKGSCQPEPNPDACHKDGDECGDDRDCCYGSRCCYPQRRTKHSTKYMPDGLKKDKSKHQSEDTSKDKGKGSKGSKDSHKRLGKRGGRCTPVTYENCHKDCYDFDCYVERKKDCDALYATSAAKLSATGAKYMV
jgi:hypothetical protein